MAEFPDLIPIDVATEPVSSVTATDTEETVSSVSARDSMSSVSTRDSLSLDREGVSTMFKTEFLSLLGLSEDDEEDDAEAEDDEEKDGEEGYDSDSEVDLSELWEPFLQERYLGYHSGQERPIWGAVLDDARNDPKAFEIIGTDNELVEFVNVFFTSMIVEEVKVRFEMAAASCLGSAYCKRGVYFTFVEELISQLMDYLGLNSGSQTLETITEITDAHETQEAREAQDADGSKRPVQGPILQENFGGGKSNDSTGKSFFQAMTTVYLHLSEWQSPPAIKGDRKRSTLSAERDKRKDMLQRRSQYFHSEFPEAAKIFQYRLGDADPDSHVYLYHATRIHHISNFKAKGISPRPHRSDFSKFEAFYCTDSLRYAYQHAILNVGRKRNEQRQLEPWDYVAILCFLIPVGELHGIVPISG